MFAAAITAIAVCGIPAGYVWGALAPRVLLQVVSKGVVAIANAETPAFIAADAWFCLISAVGGVLTGALGYLLAVRRRGAVAATGLITGALGGSLLMMWVGDNDGLAAFRHRVAVSAVGAHFDASLGLGAKSALVFWPMFTALTIAVLAAAARPAGRNRREHADTAR